MRRKLGGFLERESREHEQVVVKDPRTVWAQPLWREVATEMGFHIRFVSMLRHPAEVVGSDDVLLAIHGPRSTTRLPDVQRRSVGQQLTGERARYRAARPGHSSPTSTC